VKVYGAGIQIEHSQGHQKAPLSRRRRRTGEVIVGQHKSSNPATVNLNFVALGKTMRGGKQWVDHSDEVKSFTRGSC